MNLIPKLAEMLGVEIGEEFIANGKTVVLKNEGLYYQYNAGYGHVAWKKAECTLFDLLTGECEVKKLPYEPKPGEEFFYVSTTHPISIGSATWVGDDCTIECAFKYCGNCFRTKAEAEKQKYEVYERITGKKWGHDND